VSETPAKTTALRGLLRSPQMSFAMERTKAALKAAKARGVRLGRYGAEVLAPQYRQEALQRAEELEPVITELREKDHSLAKIARELNKRKVATPRGGRWDHSSVRNVLKRLEVDSAG
jgi:DNA invertase Pin-like site-specific DNA recombinase